MKNNLELRLYKTVIESLLSDDQKVKRKKFANWTRTSSRKEDIMKILFSFDIDDAYNVQNARVWVVSRADADKKCGIQQRQNFP